jgi:hypothetical protein
MSGTCRIVEPSFDQKCLDNIVHKPRTGVQQWRKTGKLLESHYITMSLGI